MALLDGDVAALHVSQLLQALPKRREPALVSFLPLQRQIPDARDLRCRLRLGDERRGEKAQAHGTEERATIHHAGWIIAVVVDTPWLVLAAAGRTESPPADPTGLEVAYQLRRINHHLKVFAAVRKEAYARLPQRTAMSQQYRGSAVDIVYSRESLREIFVNNIRLMKADRMVLPGRLRADPLEAFLGRTHVTHTYTREQEDAFDYLCR